MAASDPSPYVATPTGTLQGVAAFSWDGSVWQPSGRAGPDVATPTGVLQGVAPFSWSGSAWTPAGRAQPGVATPTGVLDGVAIYTWSGSAWTPPGGTAAPATPSGALRGVAAFGWDGTAWQPAAQARASVPTPYGVLDGVAFFNWSGSAWQAGAAVPPGATLDLSFFGPTLDPSLTFTRGSVATYFDATGTMQTVSGNAPRFDNDPVTHAALGLLIEEQRTNIALSSADFTNATYWAIPGAAVTITVGADVSLDGVVHMSRFAETTTNAVHYVQMTPNPTTTAAQLYTLSFYAKAGQTRYLQAGLDDGGSNGGFATYDLQAGVISGALAVRGTGGIGTASMQAVGNGIYRCSMSASITTTTMRATLVMQNTAAPPFAGGYLGNAASGLSVWGAQLELGAFPTSYIPTTAAAVTRSADIARVPPANMGFFVSPNGSWQAEFIGLNTAVGNYRVLYVMPGGPGSVTQIFVDTAWHGGQYNGAAAAVTVAPNVVTPGAVAKIASTSDGTTGRACLNASAIASSAMAGGYSTLAANGFGFMQTGLGVESMTGYIRRVRYWPRVLSNAELQQVTT